MYGGSVEMITRHALHCGRAAFFQPLCGERVCLHSPLPKDFRALLLQCGMDPQEAEDGLKKYFDTAE